MALPVITNNSPSAGYISWTATNVTWGTYSFVVAAGNTNKLYTWWEFRNGTPAIVSSDTYPANLLPEDLLLFLNKDGVGMLVPDASVMNGALIVPGTIYAYAIHGDEIQGYHIKANQIAATHLQADSVVADKVAANAITTEKLAAGAVSDDLVANGSFEDLDTATPFLPEGFVYPTPSNGTVTVDTTNATSGTQCLKVTATTTAANVIVRQAPEKYIPVSVASNRKWYISLRAAASTAVTTGMTFRVNWYNSAKTFISSTTIVTAPAMDGTWGIYEGQVQPVATARFMGLELQVLNPNVIASFYFDELTAREVVMTAMIADGAISTPKLIAGSVSVDKLTAGSVSSNLVVNGSFEDFDATSAPLGFTKASEVNGTIQVIQGASTSGAYATRLNATTTAANLILRQAPEKYIPVSVAQNRKWYVSVRAGTDVAVTTGMTFRVNWYDVSKALLSSTTIVTGQAMTSTWGLYEGQVTPPANTKYMALEVQVLNPNVVAQFLIDELTAQEVVVSAMIGDGEVIATKIKAGAITAQAIAANAVGAQNMIISDLNNYWQNPDFESEAAGVTPAMGLDINASARVKDISAWAGMAGGAAVNGTSAGNGSARALEVDAKSGSNNDVYDLNVFPVSPNDNFYVYFEGRYLNAAGTTGQGRLGFRTYNQAGTAITWVAVASLGTTKTQFMTPVEGYYQVPDGTYFLQPWVSFSDNGETTNKFIIDNIEVRKRTTGELLVDGVVTATKIKVDAVETQHIKADAVVATKIAAGAILAKALSVGDIENLAFGGEFDSTDAVANWTLGTGISYSTGVSYQGTTGSLVGVAGTGARSATLTRTSSVKPGDQFYYEFYYKTSADFNGTSANSKFRLGDQAGGLLVSAPFNVVQSVNWTKVSGNYTVPGSGVTGLTMSLIWDNTVGSAWIDALEFRKLTGSVLIQDGAINATKISANSVTATALAANSITATALAANSITATAIAANSITATALAANSITATALAANSITATAIAATAVDGKTITGATIQTSNAGTGARIIMNSTSLKAWDAANVNYLTADSAGLALTGELTTKGLTDESPNPNRPISTIIGPVRWSTAMDTKAPAVYFKRDDQVISTSLHEPGAVYPPTILSRTGDGIRVRGLVNPASTDEAYLQVGESNQGGGQLHGSLEMLITSSPTGRVVIGGGNHRVDIYGSPLYANSMIQMQPVASAAARDALAAPNGSTVIRTDMNGSEQRYRSGRWDLFDGSATYPTMSAGYQNLGGNFHTAHAYFEGERVHLGGIISVTAATITTTGGATYTLCTLPLEYSPTANEIFRPAIGPVLDSRVIIYVNTNGTVQWYSPTTLSAASTTSMWWSLAGISFRRRPY